MANEISTSVSLSVSNSGLVDNKSFTKAITQNVGKSHGGVVAVTTSEMNLSLTLLSTNGVIVLKNLDSTNFISAGLDDSGTGKFIIKLKPGEPALFRLVTGVNLRLKADTATCNLQYLALND